MKSEDPQHSNTERVVSNEHSIGRSDYLSLSMGACQRVHAHRRIHPLRFYHPYSRPFSSKSSDMASHNSNQLEQETRELATYLNTHALLYDASDIYSENKRSRQHSTSSLTVEPDEDHDEIRKTTNCRRELQLSLGVEGSDQGSIAATQISSMFSGLSEDYDCRSDRTFEDLFKQQQIFNGEALGEGRSFSVPP